MTKQELFDEIQKQYAEWRKCTSDDTYLAEMNERDVMNAIIRYAYEHNIEIPGYDWNEVFAFIDRDTNVEGYDPDDDDFNLMEIYNDISMKLLQEEIVVPDEFWELKSYFEDLFWPDWKEFSDKIRYGTTGD